MQQILHQLRTGGDESFDSIDEVVPWLERSRSGKSWQQVIDYYETLQEPRLFKTHCTAEQTPGIGTANIILTSRDPRDCCVSFYHHLINRTNEARLHSNIVRPDSFDKYIERWLDSAVWYRSVKSWWPYHDHQKVLWLRYQDMKSDLATSVNRIVDFLDWEISAEQIATAMDYSSFQWMKQHDEKFSSQGDSGKPLFKPGLFIRQGKVGKYKENMTQEQEFQILDKARELLEPECLQFLELDR